MVSMRSIGLTTDVCLLFATRALRLLAYGLLSVVLLLYLAARGWSDQRTGWLLSMTLLGDTGHYPLAVAERCAVGIGRCGIDNPFLSQSGQRCGTFCSE